MRRNALALLALLLPSVARAEPPSLHAYAASGLCLPAIAEAERGAKLPARLLRSIALVESGRADPTTGRVAPWPWTVNAAGTGRFYASKEKAVAAVRSLQAGAVRSIDVGCAQVNLLHHPGAFASLDSAFDPRTNAEYAARFLGALRASTGSWPLAAAAYHSSTPEIGHGYARKVMAIWPDAGRHGSLPPPPGGGAPPRPAADYSAYTPEFAARLRRMDQDRARSTRGGTAAGPVWIDRPPEPALLRPQGSRRTAARGRLPRRAPG